MAGTGVSLYATTAAGNKTVIGTIDWREDVYMPNQINDNVAQIMADIRTMANAVATGWIEIGDGEGTYTATYVSATSFRFDGVDVTAYYRAGMRVRVVAPTPGTISGTISSSTFSTHTTLVVAWDSGSLSNEAITSVSIGVGSSSGGAVSAYPLLATLTASSSATLDFTLGNTAIYSGYDVEFENLLPASNNTTLIALASSNNGGAWITAASYFHHVAETAMAAVPGFNTVGGGAAATRWDLMFNRGVSNANAVGVNGRMSVHCGLNGATFDAAMSFADGSGGGVTHAKSAGVISGAINGLRFSMFAGVIVSGIIRVRGRPK
jgi:hypothetical protein